jgi:hypothetical protein
MTTDRSQDHAVQLALRAAHAALIRKGTGASASAPPGAREARTCYRVDG